MPCDLAVVRQRNELHTSYTQEHTYECFKSGNNLSVLQQVKRFQNISIEECYPATGVECWHMPTLSSRSKHILYAQKTIIKGYKDNDSTYREHSGKNSVTRLETTALMITPRMGLRQVCLWRGSMGKFRRFVCLFCFVYFETESLCTSDWHESCYGDQASPELIEICLSLSPWPAMR